MQKSNDTLQLRGVDLQRFIRKLGSISEITILEIVAAIATVIEFEIDGVFLPPDNDSSGVIYFCEVQFQKDERLYERVFGESFLYFYRQRERFTDWQIVVIYPTRSLEQRALRYSLC